MSDRAIYTRARLTLTLCILFLGACTQERETFIPATPFAESFAPFKVVSAVAEREGLAPAIRNRGGMCTKSSGGTVEGPITTSVICRKQVEVRSLEDGARLTRTVFTELERMADAYMPQWGARRSGTPESGELHLGYCSDDAERASEPAFRTCIFLHFLAAESASPDGAGRRSITYFFTLDEERSRNPVAKVAATR
jgi:hypothetical protein